MGIIQRGGNNVLQTRSKDTLLPGARAQANPSPPRASHTHHTTYIALPPTPLAAPLNATFGAMGAGKHALPSLSKAPLDLGAQLESMSMTGPQQEFPPGAALFCMQNPTSRSAREAEEGRRGALEGQAGGRAVSAHLAPRSVSSWSFDFACAFSHVLVA